MLSKVNLLVCLGLVALTNSSASAQAAKKGAAYTEDPVHPFLLVDPSAADQKKAARDAKDRIRSLDSAKKSILLGRIGLAAEKKKFDGYYKAYFFPRMSRTNAEDLTKLPERRRELLKDIQKARGGRDYLVKNLVMPEMQKFVLGNYHPAVRYNAMLLIGELNQREYTISTRLPPIPLEEAMTFMLEQLEDEQQSDVIKVAALVGVLRHVDLNRQVEPKFIKTEKDEEKLSTNSVQQRIVDVCNKLLKQKDAPPNRSPAGHTWMQRRAVEILASAGVSGKGSSFQATVDIIADSKAPASLRCTAAAVLPNFLEIEPPKAKEIAQTLALLTTDFCEAELARIAKQKERDALREEVENAGGMLGGGMGGMGGGMEGLGGSDEGGYEGQGMGSMGGGMGEMGGGMGGMGGGLTTKKVDPLAYRVKITRRRLLYQTLCASVLLKHITGRPIGTGRAGTAWEVPEADKQFVEEVTNHIQEIEQIAAGSAEGDADDPPLGLEVASSDGSEMDDLVADLTKAIAKLKSMMPSKPDALDGDPADLGGDATPAATAGKGATPAETKTGDGFPL